VGQEKVAFLRRVRIVGQPPLLTPDPCTKHAGF